MPCVGIAAKFVATSRTVRAPGNAVLPFGRVSRWRIDPDALIIFVKAKN